MTTTQAKEARKLASTFGAVIESGGNGNWYDIYATAPAGMVWKANALHGISGGCYTGNKDWQTEAWADVLERMQYGIEPCENAECDTCHPERE